MSDTRRLVESIVLHIRITVHERTIARHSIKFLPFVSSTDAHHAVMHAPLADLEIEVVQAGQVEGVFGGREAGFWECAIRIGLSAAIMMPTATAR